MPTLRDQILAATPKLVPVECPQWRTIVHVTASLTVADRLKVVRLSKEKDDIAVDLVILAARDEAGVPLFTPEDADALAALDGGTIQAIALAVLKENGMAAGAAEDARKN